jgi:hypothetical protein
MQEFRLLYQAHALCNTSSILNIHTFSSAMSSSSQIPTVQTASSSADALYEEAYAELPSSTKMAELGAYIMNYLMRQAAIVINGKKSYIKVSYKVDDDGTDNDVCLSVRLSRTNMDGTDLVRYLIIRSLVNGTTMFKVFLDKKDHRSVFSKTIDTEKVHTETEELDALLKYIWETYYPRPMVAVTSPKNSSDDALSEKEMKEALHNAMLQVMQRNKHAILVEAINTFPYMFLKALMNADDEWVEKHISSSFAMELDKQISHEVGVLKLKKIFTEKSASSNSIAPSKKDGDSSDDEWSGKN